MLRLAHIFCWVFFSSFPRQVAANDQRQVIKCFIVRMVVWVLDTHVAEERNWVTNETQWRESKAILFAIFPLRDTDSSHSFLGPTPSEKVDKKFDIVCSHLPKHTYLAQGTPWSPRRFPQAEALSLHYDWVEACDHPKCGWLGCAIFVSGGLRSRYPSTLN